MKSFKLVFTLILLVAFVGVTALAGVSNQLKATGNVKATHIPSKGQLSARVVDDDHAFRKGRPIVEPLERDQTGRTIEKVRPFKKPLEQVPSKAMAPIPGGVYRIGTGQDFATLYDAMYTLTWTNVQGPVTLLLTQTSYTENGFYLGAVGSATNTITIQPDSNVASCVITLADDAGLGGGWTFEGSSGVTINGTKKNGTAGEQDLTIQFAAGVPGSSSDAVIRMRDGCSYMTVENCILPGYMGAGSGNPVINLTTSGAPQSHITIDNCQISNGRYGVYSTGNNAATYADAANWDGYITVSNCDIGSVNQFGIALNNVAFGKVVGNNVHDVNYTYASSSNRVAGIRVNNTHDSNIELNVVDNINNHDASVGSTNTRCYGIRINGYPVGGDISFDGINTHNRIVNNSVSRVFGTGTTAASFRDIGIEVGGGRVDSLYYNTVNMAGTSTDLAGSSDDGCTCVQNFGNRGANYTGHTAYAARLMGTNNVLVNTRVTTATPATCVRPFNDGTIDWRPPYSDHNVMYASGPNNQVGPSAVTMYDWVVGASGADVNSVGYNPYLLSDHDSHFDATQPSAASNVGVVIASVGKDLFGVTRNASTPDAGAAENAVTAPLYHDAMPLDLSAPTGFPAGLPFNGAFTIDVWNNTPNAEAGVAVRFKLYDPTAALVFDSTSGLVALPGLSGATDTILRHFTPALGGVYTFVATVVLAGDMDATNDTLTGTINAAGLKLAPYSSTFETAPEQDQWSGDGDWVLGTPAKVRRADDNAIPQGGFIQGAHSGVNAWVTGLTDLSGSTVGTCENLYSPFFDLRPLSNGYLSFWHWIETEPVFDGTNMEYSVDTGKTYHTLGVVNDPNGLNWYSTAVYVNILDAGHSFDTTGAHAFGFGGPPNFWTSNGVVGWVGPSDTTDRPTGPRGYVYVQIKLPGTVVGKDYVRFRYRYFSDAYGESDGAAFDDFQITTTEPVFAGKITGTVYTDINGDGLQGAPDTAEVGTHVQLAFFGAPIETTLTDGAGFYSFVGLKPGTYGVSIIGKTGWATTYALNGGIVTHNGVDSVGGVYLGDYQGTISGTVFSDLNDNSVKDGLEPGLAGYKIDAHTDSLAGAIVGSAVSDADGNYSITVKVGTYYITQEAQTVSRQTLPTALGSDTVIISGNSGAGSANVTGKDFGDFVFGSLTVSLVKDLNGDGIEQVNEFNPAPDPPGIAVFTVTKNGVALGNPDTIGGGLNRSQFTLIKLDTGTYKATLTYISPGWMPTTATAITQVMGAPTAALVDTFLAEPMVTISGVVYSDVNGNGVKNAADTSGFAGVTITLRGLHRTSTVTTSGATGAYAAFLGFGTDSLYVTATVPSGSYLATTPLSPAGFAVGAPPGGQNKVANFGFFKKFNVGGTAYYDRNRNGVRDAGEEGLVRILQLSVGGTHMLDTSASDGSYSFANIGIGNDTLQEITPAGWAISKPDSNNYTFVGPSATNLTHNFGNVVVGDTQNVFRTFTATEYFLADTEKVKTFQTKPAKLVMPNLITAMSEIPKNPGIVIGVPGVMLTTKISKGYVQPVDYKGILGTFYGKGGVKDTGFARGLDYFNGNVKPIQNLQKTLSPLSQNNIMVADLLALKTNIFLSDSGHTHVGLGDLIYTETGNSLSGLTLRQIGAKLDTLMTNWTTVYSVYTNFDTVIQKINAAFSGNGAFDTVSWNRVKPGFVVVKGVKPLSAVPFLKANPSFLVPRTAPQQTYVNTPPANYTLLQNYPNPFNPTTSIPFDLPQQSVVTLKIYNVLGQEVATLIDHQVMDADRQEVTFDASAMPSGVYFYRILANGVSDDGSAVKNFTQVKKMLLLK
ncbi:MAG: SdrD B-like domain-containing protein [Bacteroidota bacterium]|jgi:hypothetical protein